MAQDTKALIARTAYRMFLERGYKATTLRAIAEQCDVTHANVVYHFKGKWQLARLLVDTYAHVVDDVSSAFAEERAIAPSTERYLLYWALHHAYLASHPDFAAFYVEFGNINRSEAAADRYDFGEGHKHLVSLTLGKQVASTGDEFDFDMHLLVEADIQLANALALGRIGVAESVAHYYRTSFALLMHEILDDSVARVDAAHVVGSGILDRVDEVAKLIY